MKRANKSFLLTSTLIYLESDQSIVGMCYECQDLSTKLGHFVSQRDPSRISAGECKVKKNKLDLIMISCFTLLARLYFLFSMLAIRHVVLSYICFVSSAHYKEKNYGNTMLRITTLEAH